MESWTILHGIIFVGEYRPWFFVETSYLFKVDETSRFCVSKVCVLTMIILVEIPHRIFLEPGEKPYVLSLYIIGAYYSYLEVAPIFSGVFDKTMTIFWSWRKHLNPLVFAVKAAHILPMTWMFVKRQFRLSVLIMRLAITDAIIMINVISTLITRSMTENACYSSEILNLLPFVSCVMVKCNWDNESHLVFLFY